MSILRTTTISRWFSSKTAPLVTSLQLRLYPCVKNNKALAQRSGVFSNPSRSGFSPMHSKIVLHAETILSIFNPSESSFFACCLSLFTISREDVSSGVGAPLLECFLPFLLLFQTLSSLDLRLFVVLLVAAVLVVSLPFRFPIISSDAESLETEGKYPSDTPEAPVSAVGSCTDSSNSITVFCFRICELVLLFCVLNDGGMIRREFFFALR
mmetsp:Transcript_7525/g.11592  ORF Transcript_7525/g.11592 Transcript_7525/m.11592 type:complete len:211 (+) Transcript_7525:58-690(+)